MPRHLPEPEVLEWTIGDNESYTEFIRRLRRTVANHQSRADILSHHEDQNLRSSTGPHALLAKKSSGPTERSIHIRLQVAGETTSITLAIRDDNLMLHGFKNQDGKWYNSTGARGWTASRARIKVY